MEDWILCRWNLIDRAEKLAIRSGVLKLFDNQRIYDDIPAARTKSESLFLSVSLSLS
jgi:hypothetical protein